MGACGDTRQFIGIEREKLTEYHSQYIDAGRQIIGEVTDTMRENDKVAFAFYHEIHNDMSNTDTFEVFGRLLYDDGDYLTEAENIKEIANRNELEKMLIKEWQYDREIKLNEDLEMLGVILQNYEDYEKRIQDILTDVLFLYVEVILAMGHQNY